MYSQKIRERLEEKNIETGDKIRAGKHKGRLMPKPSSGDQETLNIKLESGYNIGIKTEDIELLEKKEKTTTEQKTSLNHSEDKQDILILHTGGTIASKVSYEEGGVKPAFDPEDLLEMYPETAELANIHSDVIAQMLSEDMEPKHWQEIAEEIHDVKDQYDGIIVGHGTDTMQYTGAALTLMLQNIDTGVILVGSQRSSDRPSTDANMNLYSATKFLTETDFNGIAACMHASIEDKKCKIMPASKIRKMHTSRRDAFQTINADPIAHVDYEEDTVEYKEKHETNGNYEFSNKIDEKVGYIKIRPGMTVEEFEKYKENDLNGLIIEGTGLGHMPVNSFDDKTQHHKEILETVAELAEDKLVVMSSQTVKGRIDMDVYDAGYKIQEAGVVSAKDMHPELAYVKAMWVLANSKDLEHAKQIFQENLQGEIRERSMY